MEINQNVCLKSTRELMGQIDLRTFLLKKLHTKLNGLPKHREPLVVGSNWEYLIQLAQNWPYL